MNTTIITARVDAETAARLDALAARLGRSRSWLLGSAIRDYVEEQTAFLDLVEEGERDIDEGRFYTQEQMDEWFAERIAAAEARIGRAKAA